MLISSGKRSLGFGKSLDDCLIIFDPIVNTAIHQHIAHIFGLKKQLSVAQDAERPADLVEASRGIVLNNRLIEVLRYDPQPFVSFNICRRDGEESAHF
jgi:hypothetical protein